jgi:hypothetical protein
MVEAKSDTFMNVEPFENKGFLQLDRPAPFQRHSKSAILNIQMRGPLLCGQANFRDI